MFCVYCGFALADQASFCAGCGAAVSLRRVQTLSSSDEGRVDGLISNVKTMLSTQEFLSHSELVGVLNGLGNAKLSVEQLAVLVDFATDQYCRWHVRWLFSPAVAPDTTAANEYERWQFLNERLTNSLVALVPAVREPQQRACKLKALQFAIQARLRHDGKDLTKEIGRQTTGWFAHGLNALGFRNAAERAMQQAIFPTGSVGADE